MQHVLSYHIDIRTMVWTKNKIISCQKILIFFINDKSFFFVNKNINAKVFIIIFNNQCNHHQSIIVMSPWLIVIRKMASLTYWSESHQTCPNLLRCLTNSSKCWPKLAQAFTEPPGDCVDGDAGDVRYHFHYLCHRS